MVATFRMQHALDDAVLVEVVADQVPDVTFGPRSELVATLRPEVQDEVGEVPSPV
jgi:hypothetical protein